MKKNVNIYRPKVKAGQVIDTQSEKTTEIQARRDEIDKKVAQMPKEYGGRSKEKGLEPTRYDDWEFKGRCIDF